MPELDLLRRLADEIVPPSLDELRTTARRRDRRHAMVVAVTGAAVVGAVAVGTLLTGSNGENSEPQPAPAPEQSTTRPLTYAEGTTIHYGDQAVEAAGPVKELDLTDDGVAFRTADGTLWFTDGSNIEELGAVGDPGPAYGPDSWPPMWTPGWMVSGNLGSRLAWFEFIEPGEPEVVVYDTAAAEEVARAPVTLEDGSYAVLHSITDDYAYWFIDPNSDSDQDPDARYDLTAGTQAAVTPEEYQADFRSNGTARTLVISHSERQPPPGTFPRSYELTDGMSWNFAIARRVVPMGEQPLIALDGQTATPFVFEAPPDYPGNPGTGTSWSVQWLDDDTVVLLSGTPGGEDLLECDVAGACAVAVSGKDLVAPELG
jgi:hypothetical protein